MKRVNRSVASYGLHACMHDSTGLATINILDKHKCGRNKEECTLNTHKFFNGVTNSLLNLVENQ